MSEHDGPATDGVLVRIGAAAGPVWVLRGGRGDAVVEGGLAGLLALPVAAARAVLAGLVPGPRVEGAVLAPVDLQEVWAAGVTYARSRDERMAEAVEPSIYDRVHTAERPEVFFKSTAGRVVAPGDPVGIRADSGWDVPEPELALVVTAGGEVFGHTVGNDMSSRSIEGENPLYLPQAKVYDAACSLGPAIVPVWAAAGPFDVRLEIERDGATVFAGDTSTSQLTRTGEDLAAWLTAAMAFPDGAVLLTGTGIVPPESFTLAAGDRVRIAIDRIGVLENPVRTVGRDLRRPAAPAGGAR